MHSTLLLCIHTTLFLTIQKTGATLEGGTPTMPRVFSLAELPVYERLTDASLVCPQGYYGMVGESKNFFKLICGQTLLTTKIIT